jgi:hypothetical protein
MIFNSLPKPFSSPSKTLKKEMKKGWLRKLKMGKSKV